MYYFETLFYIIMHYCTSIATTICLIITIPRVGVGGNDLLMIPSTVSPRLPDKKDRTKVTAHGLSLCTAEHIISYIISCLPHFLSKERSE